MHKHKTLDPAAQCCRGTTIFCCLFLVIICNLLISVFTLFTLISASSPPSDFSAFGGIAFPLLGPWLIILSILTFLLALIPLCCICISAKCRLQPLAVVSAVIAIILLIIALFSIVYSITLLGLFITATRDAGGVVYFFPALAMSSIKGAKEDEVKVYATIEGTPLHVYIYKPPTGTTAAPVLYYIHGGGWTTGTPDMYSSDMKSYADLGFLVVSVEYRLSNATHHYWNETLGEVGCGLLWTIQNAASYNADASKIFLLGDSAGGNLAINLGYAVASGSLSLMCSGSITQVPKGVIVQYPGVDLEAIWNTNFLGSAKVFVSNYIGGSPYDYPQRLKFTNSATYISKDAPNTVIIEPLSDGLVIPQSVFNFVNKAREAGVNVTVAEIPYAGHSFDSGASNSMGNQARMTVTTHHLKKMLQ